MGARRASSLFSEQFSCFPILIPSVPPARSLHVPQALQCLGAAVAAWVVWIFLFAPGFSSRLGGFPSQTRSHSFCNSVVRLPASTSSAGSRSFHGVSFSMVTNPWKESRGWSYMNFPYHSCESPKRSNLGKRGFSFSR